ncbi:universal stress protein [Reyranella sp.]|uniref:universal stress protein n=1 Tax=Reyranella sp. TaxID=1929291 RepID=UPI003D0B06C4
MSFKTILVHCDAGTAAPLRLEVATQLASRFDASLVGVHATPPFATPLFMDDGFSMAPLFEAYEEAATAAKAASRAVFDRALKGKHLSTEWRPMDGPVDDVMTVCGRYADLLVVGQSQVDDATQPGGVPESIALASGRPVLVVPFVGADKPLGHVVMLCWNASRESARAAADALPFLKAAQKVIVLVVEPKVSPEGHGEEPGADVATWLARHGVKVIVQRDVAPDADVGNIILSRAADHDVDLIVMGLYGHSRLREMVLGGVSWTMLSSMTVPVLMAH